MKYFCTENERVGTCYHEFYKGRFDGKSFWQADSILIHEDIHYSIGMGEMIVSVIPKYHPCGEVEVTPEDWRQICKVALIRGGGLQEAILEATPWVEKTFEEYEVFTMLGI